MEAGSEKRKLELINIISCKINEPLEFLKKKLVFKGKEELNPGKEDIKKIQRAIKEISFLNYKIEKISSEKKLDELRKPKKKTYFIKNILDEAIKKYKQGISINISYKLTTNRVYLDKFQIIQTLDIILENLIVFNPENREIEIEVANTEKDLTITISAEPGEGLENFIFNKNLTAAEEIIRAHKGEIRIENNKFITVFIPSHFKSLEIVSKEFNKSPVSHVFILLRNFIYYFANKFLFRKKNLKSHIYRYGGEAGENI